LWTGDGATTRSITNASSFKPDLIWIKGRSNTGSNLLQDSNRGFGTATKLSSNSTNAENNSSGDATDPIYGYITAANSNGFSVNVGTVPAQTNNNGVTFVGWQWQAGQGSTSSNTSGSITSTVSVNATAGFSIVTYTSNNTAGATVGHGLGIRPSMIILKRRSSTSDWDTYHISLGATKGISLNTTGSATTSINYWNNTEPTSTVFTLGAGVNPASTPMLAYCWAEIAGFSKFGSFTANNSSNGNFIYLGFRPRWIMTKQTSGSGGAWFILDTARNTFNVMNNILDANTSGAERNDNIWDATANGMKLRIALSGDFIYAAFAENPFKNALAR
jgi:hypothetical protein